MAKCGICLKDTAVSLYVRVKPIWDGKGSKWRAPKDKHMFFGYWPPESHLTKYFELELARGESILQPLFQNNCRGHDLDMIADAIEAKMPPIPGMPIRILWNPSPRVTPLLLAEGDYEKLRKAIETTNDLRTVTIDDISGIRLGLVNLFSNAQIRVEQSISLPNSPVMRH